MKLIHAWYLRWKMVGQNILIFKQAPECSKKQELKPQKFYFL